MLKPRLSLPKLPPRLLIFIVPILSVGASISHSHVADPQHPPVTTLPDIRMWKWSDDAIFRLEKSVVKGSGSVFAFSPDGKHLAVVSGTSIWIHDIYGVDAASGVSLLNDGHATTIRSLAYSPDGLTLAAGTSNGMVQLWGVRSQRLLDSVVLDEPDGKVEILAFSPDGKTLASGTRDEIELWNMETRAHLVTLRGNKRLIVALAFSPDGETLAFRAEDDTVRLWELATGKNLATFKYPRPVSDIYDLTTQHFKNAKTADKVERKAEIERVITEFRYIATEYADTRYGDLSLVRIGEAYMILADEEEKYLNDALDYFDKLWVKYADESPVDAQVSRALRIAQSRVAAIASFMESNNIPRRQTGGAD